MVLKINFVDAKIMTMLANYFVTIEQVKFFPKTLIYCTKKLSSSPQRKTLFPSSTSVLAVPAN